MKLQKHPGWFMRLLAVSAMAALPWVADASMYLDENGVTWYYQKLNDDSAVIVNSGDNSAFSSAVDPSEVVGNVTIPSKIYDLNVVGLGEKALYGCTKVTSVAIPEMVRDIGADCFNDCDSLSMMEIPENVATVGDRAFFSCSALKTIVLSENVTTLGKNSFAYCSKLESVTIPASVSTVGASAFYSCNGMTNVVFSVRDAGPSQVIGDEAFYGCTSLQSVSMSSNVVSIGKEAFQNCSSLERVVMSSALASIGENAFYKCKKLSGDVAFSSNLARIEANAFFGCSGLSSIVFEDGAGSVKLSIDKGAFFGCSSVTNLYLPDRTEFMGEGAFQSLSSLVNVRLPSGMETVTESLFADCRSLTSIDIPGSVTGIGSSAFYFSTNLMHFTIPAKTDSVGAHAFKSTGWWNSQPDNSIVVKDGWLLGVKGTCPPDVVLSNDVRHIADGAFSGCSTLTNIIMSESVLTVGALAFRYCTNLTSVVMSTGTYLDPTAFYDSSWYPTGDGGGIVVDPTAVVTNYFIAFHPNGGVGNVTTQTFRYGYAKSLMSNEFTRATFSFDGWSVSQTGTVDYADGEIVSNLVGQIDGTLNLYAHWTQMTNLYEVVFHPNGGTGSMASQKFAIGETQSLSSNLFLRTDYIFKGWAMFPTGDVEYVDCQRVSNLSTNVGAKVGLYARWGYTGVIQSEIQGGLLWHYSASTNGTATIVNIVGDVFVNAVEGDVGESLSIPEFLGSNRVVAISENAFKGFSELASVHIPASVKSIGAGAFSGCGGIKSATMPMVDALKDIFPDSYKGILSVTVHGTEMFLDDEVELPVSAFEGCQSLVSVTLPLGVSEIPDNAFDGCASLKEFEMPYTVTAIGERAFAGCSSMETITVTEYVDTIGANAFTDCVKLRIVRYLGDEPSDVADGGTENIYYHSNPNLVSGYLKNIRSWPSAVRNSSNGGSSDMLPDDDLLDPDEDFDEDDFDDDEELEEVAYYSARTGGEIMWPEGTAGRKLMPWNTNMYSFRRVVFNYNDGGKTPSKEVFYVKGRVLGELPSEDDKELFIGWFTERYGGVEVDPYHVVDAPAVFYAHWESDIEVSDRGGMVESFEPFYEYENEDGFSFAAATFDGLLMDGDSVAGVIEIKTKKGKYVKALNATNSAFTAKIHVLGDRKFTMSGTIGEDGTAYIESERAGRSLELAFTQFGLEGACSTEYGDYSIVAARDRYSAGSEDGQRLVRIALANARHDWLVVLPTADVDGDGAFADGYSTLSISVSSQGKAKIKGQMADGTKVSASSKLIVGDGCCCIPVFVPLYSGKKGGFAFALWFTWSSDQSESIVKAAGVSGWDAQYSKIAKFTATFGEPVVSRVGTVMLPEVMTFNMDGFFDLYGAYDSYSPDGTEISVVQNRWKLPKADGVRFSKDEGWYTADEKDYGNPAGLKLSYTAKTGQFKGSFKVYAETETGRSKKHSAKVTGVVVDGIGYGTATVKNIGSVKITIE